jgi:two-component system chemotaxis response regulator CheY
MATVLVADYSDSMRAHLASILRNAGHAAVGARDGAEAVGVYRAVRPDAVIMEAVLPVLDGLHALGEIIEMDPDARVVIVTVITDRNVVEEAMEIGACDYIAKPFEADSIIQTLGRALMTTGEALP